MINNFLLVKKIVNIVSFTPISFLVLGMTSRGDFTNMADELYRY
jgi:hypothetical protein